MGQLECAFPQGLKPRSFLGRLMYGLKPVPFTALPVPFTVLPVPFTVLSLEPGS